MYIACLLEKFEVYSANQHISRLLYKQKVSDRNLLTFNILVMKTICQGSGNWTKSNKKIPPPSYCFIQVEHSQGGGGLLSFFLDT